MIQKKMNTNGELSLRSKWADQNALATAAMEDQQAPSCVQMHFPQNEHILVVRTLT